MSVMQLQQYVIVQQYHQQQGTGLRLRSRNVAALSLQMWLRPTSALHLGTHHCNVAAYG